MSFEEFEVEMTELVLGRLSRYSGIELIQASWLGMTGVRAIGQNVCTHLLTSESKKTQSPEMITEKLSRPLCKLSVYDTPVGHCRLQVLNV